MTRAPRAKVSKTSGQGVSRFSYQKGYALGNRGTGSPGGGDGGPSVKSEKSETSGGRRSSASKLEKSGDMNISYGSTLPITDVKTIGEVAKNKAPTPGFLKQGKAPAKATKDSGKGSGFLKGRK